MRGLGAFVACEGMPPNERMAEGIDKLVTIEDRYGILLDIRHRNIRQKRWELYEADDFISSIDVLPLLALKVRLHDNKTMADDHLYLGYGTLPLDAVVTSLRKKRFDGVLTAEIAQSGWRPPRHWARTQAIKYARLTRDRFLDA